MRWSKALSAIWLSASALARAHPLATCVHCRARQATGWLQPYRGTAYQGQRGRHVLAAAGVNVIYSNRFLEHRMGGFHPEQPTRVSTAAKLLKTVEGVSLISPRAESDPAAFAQAEAAIRRVHDPGYVEEIKRLCESGGGEIDSDTYACPQTYEVCVIAAGAWLDAVDSTLTHGRPSFALTRPPGHHALADQAMGFCIFNFAVIAARYALDVLGLQRVAILDWDVHHGNGIAELVQDDPRIRYCSLHQEGSFPLTGLADDEGPLKTLLHLPLPAYTDVRGYLPLYRDKALPFLHSFKPDLVIISAGYDTLNEDNLAQLCMNPADYTTLSSLLLQTFGPDKLVFGLEGGYEPGDTAEAIKATIEPLLASPKQ